MTDRKKLITFKNPDGSLECTLDNVERLNQLIADIRDANIRSANLCEAHIRKANIREVKIIQQANIIIMIEVIK